MVEVQLLITVAAAPDGAWRIDYELTRPDGTEVGWHAQREAAPPRGAQALTDWLLSAPATTQQGTAAHPWQQAEAQAGDGGRIRLLLDCKSPELAARPWEQMQHPQDQFALAYADRYTFARLTPNVGTVPTLDPKALTVEGLVVSDLPGLAIAEDYGHAPWASLPGATVNWQPAASVKAFRQALARQPDVLVLVSHGGPIAPSAGAVDQDHALYLSDAGAQRPYGGAELVRHLRLERRLPALAFLTACGAGQVRGFQAFNDFGSRLVGHGVGAAVTMQGSVAQATVEAFMQVFVREVMAHGRLDVAMQAARKWADIEGLPGAWMPVLHVRRPDCLLFEPAVKREEPEDASRPPHPVPPASTPLTPAQVKQAVDLAIRLNVSRTFLLGFLGAGVTARLRKEDNLFAQLNSDVKMLMAMPPAEDGTPLVCVWLSGLANWVEPFPPAAAEVAALLAAAGCSGAAA